MRMQNNSCQFSAQPAWQVATQLISAAMVIYALRNMGHASTTALLLRPWFIALVAAGAIERLAGLALGVSMERDWVVLVRLLIHILFLQIHCFSSY